MRWVRKVELVNWLRYRGAHSVELEPIVYSVVASKPGDVGRSNWLGKTGFLESIYFALYGWHRWDTDDEWITRGERSGQVRLVFDDWSVITRSKTRGEPSALVFEDGDRTVLQASAQEMIEERLGLSRQDFINTSYFEQKCMSRLITMRPGDRMRIVSEWAQLGPLQIAEDGLKSALAGAISVVEKHDATRLAGEATLRGIASRNGHADAVACEEELRRKIASLGRQRDDARCDWAAAIEDSGKLRAWRKDSEDAVRYAQAIAERRKVEVQITELLLDSDHSKEAAETLVDERAAAKEVAQKKALACGKFDGACPVDGRSCPVADDINSASIANQSLLEKAQQRWVSATKRAVAAQDHVSRERDRSRERARFEGKLELMADSIKRLKSAFDFIAKNGAPPDTHVDSDSLMQRATGIERQLAGHEHDLKTIRTVTEELALLGNNLSCARAEVDRQRAAIHVLRETRKQVVEATLADIQEGANDMLTDAGIELGVQVTWGRETGALATTCEACGCAFPSSRKVRACTKCSEPRGPKIEERLDIGLTDKSGGADDLAGVGVQLAAAAWRRRQRGAEWSVALVDEPFGALDQTHRRAFAAHLASMLRGRYGFEQAFVIAHDSGTTDAMPGRILITGEERGSRVEVV